jgi:hypothetical protein
MGRSCITLDRDKNGIEMLMGKPEGKKSIENAGMGGRLISKRILGNRIWAEVMCLKA